MRTRLAGILLLALALPCNACERSSGTVESPEPETVALVPCPDTVSCHEDATCSCDDRGNVVLEEGRMGQVTWSVENTYDEAGNKIASETHTTGYARNVPERWTFTYDENGNQLTSQLDRRIDGRPEYRSSSEWDEDGTLIVLETDGELVGDSIADGTMDSRQIRTHDNQGNLLKVERDDGADGSVDSRCNYDPPCPPEVYQEAVFRCSGPCVDL